jgi:hypothetical protein
MVRYLRIIGFVLALIIFIWQVPSITAPEVPYTTSLVILAGIYVSYVVLFYMSSRQMHSICPILINCLTLGFAGGFVALIPCAVFSVNHPVTLQDLTVMGVMVGVVLVYLEILDWAGSGLENKSLQCLKLNFPKFLRRPGAQK